MATVRKSVPWFISGLLLMVIYFNQSTILKGIDKEVKPVSSRTQLVATAGESFPSDAGETFRDLIKPNISCDDNNTVIVFVLSMINSTQQRDLIRATWGNVSLWNGMAKLPFPLYLFYVVGTPCVENDTSLDDDFLTDLADESSRHGDLFLSDANDCYGNLTNKVISALALVNRTCQLDKISYIFKTDDDVFVNVPRLLRLMNASVTSPRKRCHLLCKVIRNSNVLRDGKWALPIDLFPWKQFPFYCQGMGYAFCRRGLELLFSEGTFPKIRPDPFPLEDVFMTSLALRGSNWTAGEQLTYDAIKHNDVRQKYTSEVDSPDKYVMIHRLPWNLYKKMHEDIVVRFRNSDKISA